MITTRQAQGLCLGLAMPVLAFTLSACAHYKWVHPTLPDRMADKAKLRCEDESLKVYPITIVQDVTAGRSQTQGTQCNAQAQKAECSDGGSKSTTASTYSKDINEQPRRERVTSCMRAAGWTEVEVPRK